MFCPYCGKESGDNETCGDPDCLAGAAAASAEPATHPAEISSRPATETDALYAARAEMWRSLDDARSTLESIDNRVAQEGVVTGPVEAIAPLVGDGGPYGELKAIDDAVGQEIEHLGDLSAEVKRNQNAISRLEDQLARRARNIRTAIIWAILLGAFVAVVLLNESGGF